MSGSATAISKTWLNAKDNWLGEGSFRPAQYELMRVAQNIAHKATAPTLAPLEKREPAEAQACDIYFAHG
jgi:hypothetical protein